MVHLTTVGLCGLKLIAYRRDVVVKHWVAALSHPRLSYGVFVNLQRLLMQFLTPIIRLTQESFRLLFKVPQLISDVLLEVDIQIRFFSKKAVASQIFFHWVIGVGCSLAEDLGRTEDVFFSDKEFHYVIDYLGCEGGHRGAVALHLVYNGLKQVGHPLKHHVIHRE